MTNLVDPFDPPQSSSTIKDPFDLKPPTPVNPIAAPAADGPGDFARGLQRTLPELKQLGGGTMAAIGDVTGIDAIRDKGLEIYKAGNQVVSGLTKPNDSATEAWKQLKAGNVGAGVDFLQNAAGYTAGQALESIAAAGAGAAIGAAATPEVGGAGAIPGAIGGFVAKQGLKRAVKGQAEKIIAEQVAKGVAKKEAKQAGAAYVAEHAGGEALAKAAGEKYTEKQLRKIGGATLGTIAGQQAMNTTMELGSVYPEAIEKAHAEGRELTKGEKARAVTASLGAAGLESVADMINLGILFRGTKGVAEAAARQGLGAAAKRYAGRAAVAGAEGAAREAGTEGAQTFLERVGANQSLNDADAWRDYVDSAAVGAVGGIQFGGVAAVHPRDEAGQPAPTSSRAVPPPGADPADALRADVLQARSPKERAEAAQALFDHLQAEGRLLPPPAPITVDPAGVAVTPAQGAKIAQQRAALGLSPDVETARAAHPGAAPNLPFPEALPGTMASAANTLATAAAHEARAAAPPPGVDPATGEVLPAQQPQKWTRDQVKTYLAAQLERGHPGAIPKASLIARTYDMKPAEASALRKEVIEESKRPAVSPAGEAGSVASLELAAGEQGPAQASRPASNAPAPSTAQPSPPAEPGLPADAGVPPRTPSVSDPSAQATPAAEPVQAEPAPRPAATGEESPTSAALVPGEAAAPSAATTAPAVPATAEGVVESASANAVPAVGAEAVNEAAHEAATSPQNGLPVPTDGQIEAGNYKKGHVRIAGLDISIENPAGSKRRPEWPALAHHYGYIKGTIGKDKDHVDVFLTEHAADTARPVFIVDQRNEKGGFDEHKVVLGAATQAEAKKAYLANYSKGWKGAGSVTQMTHDQFETWVRDPAQTKRPASALQPNVSTAAEPTPRITRPGSTSERDEGFTSIRAAMHAVKKAGLDTNDYDVQQVPSGFVAVRKSSTTTTPEPKPTSADKRAQIDASFAANRQAIKDKGLKKGDTVTWTENGQTVTGTITTLGDKEQAVVNVGRPGRNGGVRDTHVGARLLTKGNAEGASAPKAAPDVTPNKPTKAQRDEAKAAAVERQRETYRALVADAGMIGKSVQELTAEVRARLDGSETPNGKIEQLARLLHKEIKQKAAETEKNRHRDPAVLAAAIADAASGTPHAEGEAFASFNAGFGHALAGKTKSTMVGEDLPAKLVGYAAARAWMRTEVGRAFYEGRPSRKLENTGADLRRHWDALKAQATAKQTDATKTWSELAKATNRAELFGGAIAATSPPGLRQWVNDLRDMHRTFTEFLEQRYRWYGSGSWGRRNRSGISGRNLELMLAGERYPSTGRTEDLDEQSFMDDESYRIEWLQQRASEYLDGLKPVVEALSGVNNVLQAAANLDRAMFKTGMAAEVIRQRARSYDQRNTDRKNGLSDANVGDDTVSTPAGKAYENSGVRNGKGTLDRFTPASSYTQVLIEKETSYQLPTKATPLTPPRLDRVNRSGLKDNRKGKNVTPAQFKAALGFADVGFGKWVAAKQDQDHLNYAYDAFMDLAQHFGIPPKMIGFGDMHFTIGALGHGKFAAHFQARQPHPQGGTVPVINVTNTKGDGTVYHEWGHAFDLHGAGGEWSKVRQKIVHALRTKVLTPADVEERVTGFLLGHRKWSRGRYTVIEAAREALSPYQFNRYAANTDYYRNALALDGSNKRDPYWSNDKELFARAVEAWAGDTLGGTNTYLVNAAWSGDGAATSDKGYRGTPYPRGAERELFAKALDALRKATSVVDGKVSVSLEKFNEHFPDPSAAAEARRKELLQPGNMEAFNEQLLVARAERDQQREQERADKAAHERAESDRLAQEALAALEPVAPPVQAGDTMGPLTDSDLEAIFDEAAAELREAAQEQPKAPTPGAAIEKLSEQARPKAAQPAITTKPDLSAQQEKTAAALAKEAAKLGVQGVDEAMQGLVALFGGGKGRLNSFPSGFDEDAYAAAKPHFQAALKAFQAAGKSLKDLFAFLIQHFGDGIKMYAIQFAKDEALTSQLGGQQSASVAVADWVSERLAAKQAMDWRALFARADKAFGGTQAEGKYTPKDAYDALEAGVNRYIMAQRQLFNPQASAEDGVLAVARLDALMPLLPTQTKRTAEHEEFQQFSTVPPLAYIANWVANVSADDVMLEPSAGIGGLAAFAKNAGAKLILNELSSRRAALLQEVFPSARVFHENAEQIDNILPEDQVPSVVVMNPPFSATAGRLQGQRNTQVGAQHVEQALNRLAPGGRLVAIVGDGMNWNAPAFATWWARIGKTHTVKAAISMSGAGYAKYGTTYDNVLLVIDKVAPNGAQNPVVARAEAYNQLLGLLAEIRNDRPTASVVASPTESVERDGAESARLGPDEPGEGGAGTGTGVVEPAGVGVRASGDEPGVGTAPAGPGSAGGTPRPGGPVRAPRGGRAAAAAGDNAGAGGNGAAATAGRPGAGARPDSGLSIEAGEAEKSGELTDSIFDDYQPQRLKVPGAKPHPGPLVQSAAMASVLPPAPTYTPNLPKATIEKGLLSLAQIESVVYAGQAHGQILPNGERRGFFIGDGTGVGKGREIGGILLDNLRQGRNKAVWVSEKQGLMVDAKRDLKGVGGDSALIFNQNKTTAEGAITDESGIVFTTYSTLRSGAKSQKKKDTPENAKKEAGQSRLDQLVKWLGPEFDGVIVFDEAHNAGNAVAVKGKRGGSKPSEQALAVVKLQTELPKARVVYVSATGATQVANLSYATRLGLWGEGTPFPGVQSFIDEMTVGGLANMELVARDMKQMGAYLARSLSYEGVTYSRVEHELSTLQSDIYNRLAEAWQVTLQNFEAALEMTGAKSKDGKTLNSRAVSAAKSAYWGGQQRFFNQIITAMQMPSVIEQIERDMQAGHAIVLQLVNTNEAQQERALGKKQEDGEAPDLEELDLTPRDQLIQMVEHSFPIVQMQQVMDGDKMVSQPVMDADGKPVENREAKRLRDKLLEDLVAIRVPDGPLEIILNHFGPDVVAEVTGRGRRVVRKPDADGNVTAQIEKRGANAGRSDAEAFLADKKRILLFSDAGGTGFSFHADLTKANQRRRMHYLIQPGWRADKAVQGFGRTHRTNQASTPHYYLAATNIPAHKRFLSSIARRLDQLGALTKGQRDTANQGMFSEKDNLESVYATQAVRQLFEDGLENTVPGLEFMAMLRQMGLENIVDENTGKIGENSMPPVSQFLNRMLSLTLDMQEKVFDAFMVRVEQKIETAISRGEFDAGMQTIKAIETKIEQEETIHSDPRTGAETTFLQLKLTVPNTFYNFPNQRLYADAEWTRNKTSGRVWLKVKSGTQTLTNGAVVDRYVLRGTSGTQTKSQVELYPSGETTMAHFDLIDEADAKALWEKENGERPPTIERTTHLITGAILPVWDRLKTKGRVEVVRTQTQDGRRLLGRQVMQGDVAEIRKRFSISSAAAGMAPLDVMKAILSGQVAELSNGWKLERARVSNDLRIELKVDYLARAAQEELERMGLIKERIDWKERMFVPVGASGVPVLERLFASKPLVDVSTPTDGAFSRPDSPSSGGVAPDALAALVARWTANWTGDAPAVVTLATADGQPDAAKAARGWQTAEGYYDDASGTVYLVASNLRDTARAKEVLAHEAIGHYGIEAITSPALWQEISATVRRMRESGKHAALFAEIGRRYVGANDGIFIREAVAVMAEKGIRNSVMDRVIAAVRRFLRNTLGLDLRLSEAELRQHIVAAARYVRGGSRPRRLDSGNAFSQPQMNPTREIPVTVIQGGKFGSVATAAARVKARARALEWLEGMRSRGTTLTNEDSGITIGFSRTGNRELVTWTARPERIELLAALPGITRRAMFAGMNEDTIDGAKRRWATFYAPVRIGGALRVAKLVARDAGNGAFYYDLQHSDVLETRNPTEVGSRGGGTPATKAGPIRTMTVAQIREAANAVGREGWGFSRQDVRVVTDGRGRRSLTLNGETFLDRGGRFYMTNGTGEPKDFRTLGAATQAAQLTGGEVLVDDPVEGEPPSWSVVLPDVLVREASTPLFSQADPTDSEEFRRWFGDSKIVDAAGAPLTVYHGTDAEFSQFSAEHFGEGHGAKDLGDGFYFSDKAGIASGYGSRVMRAYVRITNPATNAVMRSSAVQDAIEDDMGFTTVEEVLADLGYDGIVFEHDGGREIVAFNPEQIRVQPESVALFSRPAPAMAPAGLAANIGAALNSARDVKLPAGYLLGDLMGRSGGLNWWHKTVGTQFNLAERSPAYRRVFDSVQRFIDDVSFFATEAADHAPRLLPKLEGWKDVFKQPVSAQDTKAIGAPIFEGTLAWTRGEDGTAIPAESVEGAGLVWTDDELRDRFQLNDGQIALYREFRAATEKSLTDLFIAQMVNHAGDDAADVRQEAANAGSVDAVSRILAGHIRKQVADLRAAVADLESEAADADPGLVEDLKHDIARRTSAIAGLEAEATWIEEQADRFSSLRERGYAPLSRFGRHSIYVTDADGEQVFFGLYDSARDANKAVRQWEQPGYEIERGTMSEESFKLFQGITPETLELFGDMLGLTSNPGDAADQAFQQFLKLTKNNRSAMKRLIHRKGTAGYSEDVGRVLASFIYSNARLASATLHNGETQQAIAAIPRDQGELKDAAIKLADYVRNPQEEAHTLRAFTFAQYLGGSIAAAMVNMTQSVTMTFPYLSQYGGAVAAAGELKTAVRDALRRTTGDVALDAAIRRGQESGLLAPQEIHQLMAQARGAATLQSGDGTGPGSFWAHTHNAMAKTGLAWGKVFSVAEAFNRRVAFIAAYRLATQQGIRKPEEFAENAVKQTQGLYSKANKPRWARGAIGGTLFTFKQFSVAYVEMLHRMATRGGPEGRRAALLALGVMFLMAGASGIPGADDLDDLIDGVLQRLGYNTSSKQARLELFASLFGQGGAQFLERGISGLPGVPIDVAGRLGMGNLIPGTGLLRKKDDHSRDLTEIVGPVGDLAARAGQSANGLAAGRLGEAALTLAPVAVRNLFQGIDMATTGMYRDTRGRKVLDTNGYEALAKAIGYQPATVARVQKASWEAQQMIGFTKMTEAEIADLWAQGLFEENADKVREARERMARWNATNPSTPIRIGPAQLRARLRAMRMDKRQRLEKTAPKEIRQNVREVLASS
jgi:hypothetical protein